MKLFAAAAIFPALALGQNCQQACPSGMTFNADAIAGALNCQQSFDFCKNPINTEACDLNNAAYAGDLTHCEKVEIMYSLGLPDCCSGTADKDADAVTCTADQVCPGGADQFQPDFEIPDGSGGMTTCQASFDFCKSSAMSGMCGFDAIPGDDYCAKFPVGYGTTGCCGSQVGEQCDLEADVCDDMAKYNPTKTVADGSQCSEVAQYCNAHYALCAEGTQGYLSADTPACTGGLKTIMQLNACCGDETSSLTGGGGASSSYTAADVCPNGVDSERIVTDGTTTGTTTCAARLNGCIVSNACGSLADVQIGANDVGCCLDGSGAATSSVFMAGVVALVAFAFRA